MPDQVPAHPHLFVLRAPANFFFRILPPRFAEIANAPDRTALGLAHATYLVTAINFTSPTYAPAFAGPRQFSPESAPDLRDLSVEICRPIFFMPVFYHSRIFRDAVRELIRNPNSAIKGTTMDLTYNADHESFREACREFAARVVAPGLRERDQDANPDVNI